MNLEFRNTLDQEDPFEAALQLDLIRSGEKLDKEVNFFILALEALGIKTFYSCGGHPKGFYIVFEAPYDNALEIHKVGFFSVAIVSWHKWRIDLNENAIEGRKFNKTDRNSWLKNAAVAWKKNLFNQA